MRECSDQRVGSYQSDVLGSAGTSERVFIREQRILETVSDISALHWKAISLKYLEQLEEGDPQREHHIIPLRGAFKYSKHPCLVFPAAGPSLYALLTKGLYRGLDIHDIRNYTRQILDALDYMHCKGLTHADLKPENILTDRQALTSISWLFTWSNLVFSFDDSEDPKRLWLIDFGLSCSTDELPVGSYMQTRYYRAPECMIGYVTSWTMDMWSLGCVCAELFLGSPLLATFNEVDQMALVEHVVG